jgi:hypothetical protein
LSTLDQSIAPACEGAWNVLFALAESMCTRQSGNVGNHGAHRRNQIHLLTSPPLRLDAGFQ